MSRAALTRVAPTLGPLAVILLVSASPATAAPGEMTGRTLTRLLRSGPVDLANARIHGDVRLNRASLRNELICHRCVFDGAFLARGATFDSIVDLRDARFEGPVDMSQVRFKAPLLMGASFEQGADFSLATFGSLATFEGAVFSGPADFTLTTFAGDAVFAHGKAFVATCSRRSCPGRATFARATFNGSADFSYFVFQDEATFNGAKFKGSADFSSAKFGGTTSFNRARFEEGVTFLGAFFLRGEFGDSFLGAESGGDINFAFTEFDRPTDFENVSAKDTISFSSATLAVPGGLHFSQVTAGSFEMSVDSAMSAVQHGSGTDDRPAVLGMIESSAKAGGDLGVANDAHYAKQVLKSHGYGFPLNVLDFVFYRTFAGYFVRPLNPVFVLLVLAAVMTLVRGGLGAVGSAGGSVGRRAARGLSGFPRRYLQTLSLIGPARGVASEERQSRRPEAFAYRLLFACALIGFANSNPTLRQMLDAIH
jgi:Pentapeptide repeats (9 copies)